MDVRPSTLRPHPVHGAALLAAALLSGLSPLAAEAQVAVAPATAAEAVVAEHDRVAAPVVSRAVLINPSAVQRLARRWYRSLDGTSALGEGRVVVYARVLADGTVAEAFVPTAAPHHPALNGLARRLAMGMRFRPIGPDGASPAGADLGVRGYWVAQRIVFRR